VYCKPSANDGTVRLHFASVTANFSGMSAERPAGKPSERRSRCPIAFSLDVFGDRWTLLVLRDMTFFGRRYFHEFLDAGEGIATNILSDRLDRLEAGGVIAKERDPDDRRRNVYRLTEKGADVIPVLLDLVVWGARYDPDTPITADFLRRVDHDREGVIEYYRERHVLGPRAPLR
jgi:DNA-binding HxlR family transcriptional regulator